MRNLYRIELEHQLGYGYLDIAGLIPGSFNSLMYYIVDQHDKEPIADTQSIIHNKKQLFPPSVSRMRPPKRKSGWKHIVESPLTGSETNIYFKYNPDTSSWKSPNWSDFKWVSFPGFDVNGLYGYDFSQVKHLPNWAHTHPDDIVTRLTMIWIKRMGKKIEDYYEFNDPTKWAQRVLFYEVTNTPFYDEIDLSDINKPIGEHNWFAG